MKAKYVVSGVALLCSGWLVGMGIARGGPELIALAIAPAVAATMLWNEAKRGCPAVYNARNGRRADECVG